MSLARRLLLICAGLESVRAGTLNVALIDNTNEGGSQFAFAFQTFWVPYINNMGGFTIAGDPNSPYTLDVVKYSFNTNTANMSVMNSVFGKIAASQDMNGNPITDRDVVVVGASQGNPNVITAAEAVGLPNFHCSGGNPFFWMPQNTRSFGIHRPYTWYSQNPILQAGLNGLKTAVIIRSTPADWSFMSNSAVSSMEWAKQAGIRVIGPTLAWCTKWMSKTKTCVIVNGACRCGGQAEYAALGYTLNVAASPSFYEVSDAIVVASDLAGGTFKNQGKYISMNLVDFTNGIIEDVRAQGGDPDLVVNWFQNARSAFYAMKTYVNQTTGNPQPFGYQQYFGAPCAPPPTSFNTYDTFFFERHAAWCAGHASE